MTKNNRRLRSFAQKPTARIVSTVQSLLSQGAQPSHRLASPRRPIYINFVCMYAGKTKAPAPHLRRRRFVFLVHMSDTFHAATFRIISRAELEITALNANKQPRYELCQHMVAIPARCTVASAFHGNSIAFKSQLILSSNELCGLV